MPRNNLTPSNQTKSPRQIPQHLTGTAPSDIALAAERNSYNLDTSWARQFTRGTAAADPNTTNVADQINLGRIKTKDQSPILQPLSQVLAAHRAQTSLTLLTASNSARAPRRKTSPAVPNAGTSSLTFLSRISDPTATNELNPQFTHALTQYLLEVLLGMRSVNHVAKWVTKDIYYELRKLPKAMPRLIKLPLGIPECHTRPRVKSIHTDLVNANLVELTAIAQFPDKSHAMALRLRRNEQKKWLCDALLLA